MVSPISQRAGFTVASTALETETCSIPIITNGTWIDIELNHKKIIMPILYATITGKHFGPPLFDSVDILGKDRVRARLLQAIEFLGGISNKKMSLLNKHWEKADCKPMLI